MKYNRTLFKLVVVSLFLYFFSFSVSLVVLTPITKVLGHNATINLHEMEKRASFEYILVNNLKIITLIVTGSFTFSILTIVNILYNGLTLGYLIGNALRNGFSLNQLILLTLPHGIFEIPAIIIAGAAGFKIPYEIIRYLAGKKEQILTKEDIKEYLTLALISIILIVIAAFVEAYITPRIAEYFLRCNE